MRSHFLKILLIVALVTNIMLIVQQVRDEPTQEEYAALVNALEHFNKKQASGQKVGSSEEGMGLLGKAVKLFGVQPRGVIHVGAHEGQEAQLYARIGASHVFWIEADPTLYARLIERVKPDTMHIFASNFAASDKDGTADFMITNNDGLSSSLLDLKEHKKLHPSVVFEKTIQVQTQRLDTFFKNFEKNAILDNFNIMVLDVQGAELMVFKGATQTLSKMDCIIAEISYVELYETSPTVDKLDNFLLEQGFVRADTVSRTKGWGDALYIKK